MRHAGVTLALYQVATATNDDRALAAGDRADRVDARQPRDKRADGVALTEADGTAPLGGAALMLAALAERRAATGSTEYDDDMRTLGDFIVSMQQRQRRLLRVV